ncbi:13283_t:CDS:1, partial [Funneliformis caledonium]
ESGYKASINHKYLDKPAIFISIIENENYVLEIYQNFNIQKRVVGNSLNEVWKISGFIKQYEGIQLFGLENSFIQKLIQ